MTESKEVVLHGGNASTVHTVEPRQANDISEFGGRNAVYAASDGIWPMYFAIANRGVVTSLVNGCAHLAGGPGEASHFYFFSISREATSSPTWVQGTVYLLPRVTFEPEPAETWYGRRSTPTQWVSPVAVQPMATLTVTPDDFPWLSEPAADSTSRTPRPERP